MLLVHPGPDSSVAGGGPRRARDAAREVVDGLRLGRGDAAAVALLAAAGVAALALLWLLSRPGSAPAEGSGGPPMGAAFALASPEPTATPSPAPTELTVHVAGLVAAPGVHRLPAGARVGDAVAAAGGAASGAVLDGVNLARPLVDGEQVLVGGPGVVGGPAGPPPGGPAGEGVSAAAGPAVRPDGLLDLNLATVDDLDALPGLGPVLAERIVRHREEIGRFTEVGELRDVSGIGEKTFQDLAPLVVV